MDRRLFILAGLALGGCATTGAAPATNLTMAELEPLYSADAGLEALTIGVASNGCTAKDDFAFYIERKGEGVTLAFGRKKIDTCKSFAIGRTHLAFTWAELGVGPRTPVRLLNPLTPWTGPKGD